MRSSMMFLFCSAVAFGQGVDGPSLGMEFDSHARALRPIRGVVGAALLGNATELSLEHATVGSTLAIGFVSSNSKVVSQRLADGAKVVLEGAPPEWQSLLLSPSETFAAFVSSGRVAVFRGAEKTSEFEIPQDAQALALSDEGVLLGNASGSLWRWSSDGSVKVADLTASAAAFQAKSARAVFAADSKLYADEGTGELNVLAGAESITALSFTSSGRVVALSASSRKAYLVRDGALSAVSLDFEPNVLRALGNDVYQVSDTAGTPLWLLDASSDLRAAFVPKSTEEAINE